MQRLLPLTLLLLAAPGCRGVLQPAIAGFGPAADVTNPYHVYVHYAVPAQRLRPHVPDRFDLVTRSVEPGGPERAFLTVTWFPQRRMRVGLGGLSHPSFDELNVRTPVRDRCTGRVVHWFLYALADPPYGTALETLSGLCTDDVPLQLTRCPATPTHGERYRINGGQTDEALPIAIVERVGGAADTPPGFASLEEARRVLLDPPLGGHALPAAGRIGWMRVAQERLEPRPGALRRLRMPSLAARGLLSYAEQLAPAAVWITPCVRVCLTLEPATCGAPSPCRTLKEETAPGSRASDP